MSRSRWITAVAAVAVVALPAATAHAQIGYGVAAGLSSPMGKFGDAVDAGYHVTGLLNVGLPLVPIGFRAEASYSAYNYKSSLSLGNAKVRILSATANAVLSTPGIIGPYLIGGVGIYNAAAVCDGCSSSSSKAGVNGGAGFRLGLGQLSAFVEARYHYIPGGSSATTAGLESATQFIPISVGITF